MPECKCWVETYTDEEGYRVSYLVPWVYCRTHIPSEGGLVTTVPEAVES